ncbi:MAG: pyridine nucleotide-disulfide oxidoreductase [Deltaproteobacteria bacterium]|nr:MAG: pyridine nucleotide-disulfide oxidoreductase [Deltaproteobacteria bacterium]
MKFIVIGGDAAGMSAASRAKRHQPDMDVIVLEKTGDVSYSACGMPYAIGDPERKIDGLIVRPADIFRKKQGIDLRTGHTVTAIDPENKTVTGQTAARDPFSLEYDKLLIATGASATVPDLPGIDLPGVMVLKTLGEGRRIKNYIREKKIQKTVIIGMGYIALEMGDALRGLGIAVDMVKPRPAFLPWMHSDLANVVRSEVEKNDVRVMAGHVIQRIEAGKDGLTVVCEDTTLPADMVLVAVGVVPNSGLAKTAGIETGVGQSIAVDHQLRTSAPDIFAAGDCADAYHVVTGQKTWVPLALRANRAGWAVADNVCGKEKSLPGIAGTAVFKVFNLEVARTGLNFKMAADAGFDPAGVVIQTRSRAHDHPGSSTIFVHMVGDRQSGKLLGVQMVGREGVAHRINAPAVALFASMTVDAFSQSDLAYAPPFGPTWDPVLTAANQLLKKI